MRNIKRVLHFILAILLILIGLVGLVLPVLNGTILLLLGFILLSFQSPYLEEHLHKMVNRNAFVEKIYKKLDTWMRKIFN